MPLPPGGKLVGKLGAIIQAMPIIAGLTLVALVLAAGLTDRTKLFGAVTVGGLGLVWLLVNQPMEGIVLLKISRDHGLTTADFTGFAALLLAAWRIRLICRRACASRRIGRARPD